MTRFALSGENWEDRRWVAAGPVAALAGQVEAVWPARHAADGTVASQAHDDANPTSDHRPRPPAALVGVVRAIDVGENIEDQGALLTEELRLSRDRRLRYVIHEGRIFSSYDHHDGRPFTWRPFRAGHLDHAHVSTLPNADNRRHPFTIDLGPPTAAPDWTLEVIMSLPTLRKGDGFTSTGEANKRPDVKRAQGLLLANGHADPNTSSPTDATDGLFGPGTEYATKAFQDETPALSADGVVGRKTWTALLGE